MCALIYNEITAGEIPRQRPLKSFAHFQVPTQRTARYIGVMKNDNMVEGTWVAVAWSCFL